MPQEPKVSAASRPPPVEGRIIGETEKGGRNVRSAFLWLSLFVLFLNGSWAVYHLQCVNLPIPVNAEQAGKRGFSEFRAMEHVKYLTGLGPHPVASDSLDLALQYVHAAAEKIKKTAHREVDVQVDLFDAEAGANILAGGLFKGRTLLYADLRHVVLKIVPKYLTQAEENMILISSHIDTVFSTEGAGDCSSCVGVMLELARCISQWAHGFKTGVIFLFNTGEEEGLNGAHSFITQHPWRNLIRFVIDLEAIGIGGKSGIFQGSSVPWALDIFAAASKYPTAQVVAQDIFHSGVIKSATDFQVYKEVGGLPGLDFAYADTTAIYHTKNDKLKLLKPGSLQHLGENMLGFLLQATASSKFGEELKLSREESHEQDKPIFFDVLGMYMVVYTQRLATMLHNSLILQSLLIWGTSLVMGGYHGVISFLLSCLSVVLMWVFSLGLSVLVAFALPLVSSFPAPYIANPWLTIGLFGAPALAGAFIGQHISFLLLKRHIKQRIIGRTPKPSDNTVLTIAQLEAERWLFKSGFVQWLLLLIVGNFFRIGSSYLALIWLACPAFAYGFIEATLTPVRLPKPLKVATLIIGLTPPVLFSAGIVIQLMGTVVGTIVRLDRNPGSVPEWLGNLVVAIFVSVVVCLSLVHLLSYVHLSGAKGLLILFMGVLFAVAMAISSYEILPTYSEDIARTVNVVHVVDTTEKGQSYVSLFSNTPGNLDREVDDLKDEEFVCGRNHSVDFVSFAAKYSCWSFKDVDDGWSESELPVLHVEDDSVTQLRRTVVSIDTKSSTRWTLAINKEEVDDFTFQVDSEVLIPPGNKTAVDGWHIIQFSGGRNSPTSFKLNLVWFNSSVSLEKTVGQTDRNPALLKLRTDINRVTPKVARVLQKLPPWSSLFGKSTSPYTLAFLATLPVNF